jgi:hypothetical protein
LGILSVNLLHGAKVAAVVWVVLVGKVTICFLSLVKGNGLGEIDGGHLIGFLVLVGGYGFVLVGYTVIHVRVSWS